MIQAKGFLTGGHYKGEETLEDVMNEWLAANAGIQVFHMATASLPDPSGPPHVFITLLYEMAPGAGT
jgi:hypothetical protein